MALTEIFLFGMLAVFLLVSAREWVAMEVSALGLLVALTLSGLLDAEEALSGFSNSATIAIAGLFVLNAGVEKTGVIAWMGAKLAIVAEKSPQRAMSLILGVTGTFSMFISNIATASLLMPAVIAASAKARISPSRFLMPVAFISLTGGMVTVIGATGNLIVQQMSLASGGPEFGFFSFAVVGLPAFIFAFIFLMLLGPRIVPARRPVDDRTDTVLRDYLVEVRIPDDSELVGSSIEDADLFDRLGITVIAINRDGGHRAAPAPHTILHAGDVLILEASADEIAQAAAEDAVHTAHDVHVSTDELEDDEVHVYEALVTPRSELIGQSARQFVLRRRSGLTLLAILRRGSPIRDRPQDVPLELGDELLLQGERTGVDDLEARGTLLVLSSAEAQTLSPRKLLIPIGVLAGVVIAAAASLLPLSTAVLAGSLIIVLAGTISPRQALEAINMKVVVVVACLLPVSIALESSGATTSIESLLARLVDTISALGVLGLLLCITAAMAQVLQKAAVVLAVPLAFAAARAAGVEPDAYLMTAAIAGGAAFLTPLAHPVNLLVYAPGQYKFRDYALVGLPLLLVTGVLTLILVPLIWPLTSA